MNNPLISRWGSNVYWRALWYSDKHYALNLQQDLSTSVLVQRFLAVGLEPFRNPFLSPLWHVTTKRELSTQHNAFYRKYYRFFSRWNSVTEEIVDYTLRREQQDFFSMRFWIVKFQKYLVLNLYWFQPLKKKYKRRRRMKNRFFFKTETFTKRTHLKRLKMILKTTPLDESNFWLRYDF